MALLLHALWSYYTQTTKHQKQPWNETLNKLTSARALFSMPLGRTLLNGPYPLMGHLSKAPQLFWHSKLSDKAA